MNSGISTYVYSHEAQICNHACGFSNHCTKMPVGANSFVPLRTHNVAPLEHTYSDRVLHFTRTSSGLIPTLPLSLPATPYDLRPSLIYPLRYIRSQGRRILLFHQLAMADRGGVPASDAASSNDTSSPATEPGIRALSKTSPFMVQDIDDPTCFICMESDKESGEQGTRDAGQTQDRFIHPCRCSLVAHESVSVHELFRIILS